MAGAAIAPQLASNRFGGPPTRRWMRFLISGFVTHVYWSGRATQEVFMDISAPASSLVFHRASPDLQRMKPLLCCARIVGTELAYPLGAIKPVH
jgi:hypothetical protein